MPSLHPRMQQFLEANKIYSRVIYRENFGAETEKALKLFCPDGKSLNKFDRFARKPKRTGEKLVRVRVIKGKKKVTGLTDDRLFFFVPSYDAASM